MEQAVLKRSASDLDMLGQLEHALEGSRRDALIEHLAFGLVGLGLLALDRQRVLLRLDRNLGLGEAGDRDRNAIGVLAGSLDVVGRVGRAVAFEARDLVEHREESVETDGRTIEGSKIERTHGISSLSDMQGPPEGPDRLEIRRPSALRHLEMGGPKRVCKRDPAPFGSTDFSLG